LHLSLLIFGHHDIVLLVAAADDIPGSGLPSFSVK